MKQRLLLTALGLTLTLFLSAQKTWIGFDSDAPKMPETSILEQNSDQVTLHISISGLYVTEIEQEGQLFQQLEIFPGHTTQEVGKPALPVISEVIGIPGNMLASVEVMDIQSQKLEGYNIYPFQTPTTDNPGGQGHPFVMDRTFYSLVKSYPGKKVSLTGTGIWRDVKITNFRLVPFDYNPATEDLEVVTDITVKISFSGQDPSFNLNRPKEVSPQYYRMYESQILNFESLGYSKGMMGNDDINYLVITNTNALSTIEPLVQWKNQQGFRVEVKTLETGFEDPADFKDYIYDLYTSDNLEYVLMVGDAYPNGGTGGGPDIVPMYWWAPGGEDPSYSDSWYTCMDGSDDHYADLAIGRFVYDDLDELELQIQKTLDHYQAPDMTTNWAENTILIAHQEQYPGKYTQCCEEIRLYPYPLQVPIFEQAYGGAGYTNQDVVNYVNNNSCGVFNYRGHGSTTELWEWGPSGSFTATHVNQLTNDDQLFVFFDVCCDNMDIVNYSGDCLCESFMKSPVASVAANGAIIPSYTIPNHDYDKEMYKALFEEGIYNIGYITNFANITVLNVHGTIGRSNVRTYLWLGDASLEPWTLQPAEMTVTHDDIMFLGLSTYSVIVNGTDGPLEGARVCLSNEDLSIYGYAFTDESGYAEIVFDETIAVPGTATLTVTGHNHVPYQAGIDVIPPSGPYVIRESFELNDIAGGNGDGLMDYGESILLSLAVENVGIAQATGVTVTLTSSDPYITFSDNTEFYGDIEPDEIISVTEGFAFDVADDIPDGHYVLVDVEAEGGSDEVWTSSFSIAGHAPVLSFGGFVVEDPTGNGNGKIDPGETADIVITVENTGSSEAFDVLAVLDVMDPYLTVNTTQVSYGSIGGAAFASGSFSVTASLAAPAGHTVDLSLDISAGLGITGTGMFNVVIGQIPVLILDLDGNGNSAPAMEEALLDMDVTAETLTAFPEDLNIYSNIFVCLGIYPSNYVLASGEGQQLADFLNAGGNLYMEGGDTWAYDSQTAVHAMFNINGVSDGSSDMGTVLGQSGTFTEGMSFNYSGENSYMDHLEAITPAEMILKNQSPSYGTGIAYDAGTYKTIGTSHEFGGLDDGASPSTKDELMLKYLQFFNMATGMQALFASNATEICEGEVINFFDQSSGDIISWDWTFEGGSPSSSAFQNPSVAYFTAGSYDVTLEVSDGTETATLTLEDYITVLAGPAQAAQPEGDDEVCTNNVLTTEYTTDGAAMAETYSWEITPADAGTIEGSGTTATVNWTMNWEGTASISVKGINDCGEGIFSEELAVACSICTGISEAALDEGIQIYPNPAHGAFSIAFGADLGSVEVTMTNMLNEQVYNAGMETYKGQVVAIDLSDLPAGIYLIRITADGSKLYRKLVVK